MELKTHLLKLAENQHFSNVKITQETDSLQEREPFTTLPLNSAAVC